MLEYPSHETARSLHSDAEAGLPGFKSWLALLLNLLAGGWASLLRPLGMRFSISKMGLIMVCTL